MSKFNIYILFGFKYYFTFLLQNQYNTRLTVSRDSQSRFFLVKLFCFLFHYLIQLLEMKNQQINDVHFIIV